MAVVKYEETGLISAAAVVSAVSENPDDGEFREQELLLFFAIIFILHYIRYLLFTYLYMEVQMESIWYRYLRHLILKHKKYTNI